MNTDQYKTIKSKSEGYFKDKGSKFFAFAFSVQTEDEIDNYRSQIRKKYHDARHHVYAFRLGADMNTFRASDDGEPANSSGPPILGKIRSFELTDILIIVVRYFGGKKLGIPGLINAYGTASEDAVNNAQIIIKTIKKNINIKFEYPQMNDVMRLIKENNLDIVSQDFQLSCEITVSVAESNYDKVLNLFKINHKLEVM